MTKIISTNKQAKERKTNEKFAVRKIFKILFAFIVDF